MKAVLSLAVGVLVFALPTAASAQTVASSNFTTGDDGWTNGDLDQIGSTSPVVYNPVAQNIIVADNYAANAFIAPAAYLGNKSGAFGGTISFQTSVLTSDGVPYTPLALFGNGLTLFAAFTPPPGLTLTSYSVSLIGSNFRIGGSPFSDSGTVATDAQLQSVLGNLQRLAIQADWQTGGDLVTLDNVVLAGAGTPGAVPEPATWGMMLLGFGAAGYAMRRRTKVRTNVSFA